MAPMLRSFACLTVLSCLTRVIASQAPQGVDCLVVQGCTLAEATGLAQALGAQTTWSPSHAVVQLSQGPKTLTYGLGCYVAATPSGLDYPGVAPVRRNGRLFVPLRHAAGCFGASLTGTPDHPLLVVGSATTPLNRTYPTAVSGDALARFLGRLDDAPVVLSSLETPALAGELQHQLSVFSADSIRPMVPTLTKISDSKILQLMGHLPAVGEFIEIGRLSLGASGELVGLLDWMNTFDEKNAAPIRRAVLACGRVQKSRDRGDVAEAVKALHNLDPALQRFIDTGEKAEHTFDKLALLRLKFMLAAKKNESLAQFADAFTIAADQLKSGKKIVQALVLQVRDIRVYSAETEAEGKRAIR